MSILSRVLDFKLLVDEEEMYFCKLEVLWILIYLSMCDTEELKLMLLSEYRVASNFVVDANGMQTALEWYDLKEAEIDFTRGRSAVLSKIEGLLK